jgi:hypothetical protein
MDPKKIQALMNMLIPTNIADKVVQYYGIVLLVFL